MKLLKRRQSVPAADAQERCQVPRFAFIWLLVAVVSVILPHVGRMPPWLTLMCLLCIVARILIFQGRLAYPGTRVKLALVGIMLVMVLLQFGRDIFSTDSTVGVLLAGITLKLLEMRRKRDVLMVLYLSYFTVVAEFIYSQSIPIAVYMGFSVVLITAALMSLNQTQEAQAPLRTLRLAAVILVQSVPLMLVFFILFPRISPLWSVPLQTSSGTTGLSDSMAPGDIGSLTRSGDVAFRVLFSGEAPPYPELYWRALTLDEFDGREWRRGFGGGPAQRLRPATDTVQQWYAAIEVEGEPVDYNVIMEPSFRNWIYTLQVPQFFDERMSMRSDYQVETQRRITQRFTYDARAYTDFRLEAGRAASAVGHRRLPSTGNPRAREFAEALRARYATDLEYVNAVLEHFRQEEFFYTLDPATLGEHPVDDFLFSTRAGFCEHYASAFTYLMRAADIPARVVTGYQGGEFNPYDGTLTVRQYDAHAWSEVWLPGRGWTRVDPTAAVAPERISQGSDIVLQREESFLGDAGFTLMRFRNSLLLNDLRLRLEMIDYAWNRFVLNYDQEMQFRFFNRLFGTMTGTRIAATVAGFLLLAMLCIAAVVFRKPAVSPKPPATVQYLRFCDHLARLGHVRRPGETPLHFMERLRRDQPQWSNELQAITDSFTELAFTATDQHPEKLRELQRRVSRFRMTNSSLW